VKKKAAEVLEELAFATPELKDLILMPGGPMKPHNVLPIGFEYILYPHCSLLYFSVLPDSTLAIACSSHMLVSVVLLVLRLFD
jgi:hypothetical protein